MLDAIGLMLWTWSAETSLLTPALIHGYEEGLVAQLPGVSPDDDNAIAWAFRSEETRTISGSDLATGALAVPLMSPAGCTGVLALELRHGHERHDAVRAVVEILAAQLSALVGHPPAAGHKVAVNT
jgi:GAF domain-containing protein